MPSNTATVGQLLKEEVEPGIVNQLNTETPLLDSFENITDAAIIGTYKVRGIQVNRNRGGYYTAEGGAPPVAGTVEIQRLLIPERYHHRALSLTKQVMNASRSNDGAFADAMRLGVQDIQEGLRQDRNRMLWGDGRGVLALVNGAANSATQTFDSPGGIPGADDGTRFINVGDWIAFVNPAGSLRAATAYEVVGVPSSSTITLGAAANTTDNDFVVKCVQTTGTLTLSNTSYMHPPMGIEGMADNGVNVNLYFGASRTTFPILNSTVLGTAALGVGVLSADIIQRGIDVAHKIGAARINELWCESGVKRAYLKLMESDRRYMAADLRSPNAGTDAAGSRRYADTGLKFGSIPLYQDPDCPYGRLYGLDTRSLKRYPGPIGWVDDDHTGQILHLSTTAIDSFDAYFRCFEQFCCEQPNQLVKWIGLTIDFVAAHVY